MDRASAVKPDMAQPMWLSISTIFSIEVCSNNDEVTLFSTPKITPSEVAIPIAVDPNLIASKEYSTWNNLPSGENVLTPLSYSLRVKNMVWKNEVGGGNEMEWCGVCRIRVNGELRSCEAAKKLRS